MFKFRLPSQNKKSNKFLNKLKTNKKSNIVKLSIRRVDDKVYATREEIKAAMEEAENIIKQKKANRGYLSVSDIWLNQFNNNFNKRY